MKCVFVLYHHDRVMTLQVFYFSVQSSREFVIRGRSVAQKTAKGCMEKNEMLVSKAEKKKDTNVNKLEEERERVRKKGKKNRKKRRNERICVRDERRETVP